MSETPTTVTLDQLVGTTELAERIGASPNTVGRWRQLHEDFPQPVLVVNTRTLVWYMPHVEQWLSDTGRTGSSLTGEVALVEVPTPTTKRDQERYAKLTKANQKKVLTRATHLIAEGATAAQAWKQAWVVLD